MLEGEVEVRHAGRQYGLDQGVVEGGRVEVEEPYALHALAYFVEKRHQTGLGQPRRGSAGHVPAGDVPSPRNEVLGDEDNLGRTKRVDLGEDVRSRA